MGDPRTLKDWRGKRVMILRPVRSRSGDKLDPGEVVIVRKAHSDGSFDLVRPEVKINGVERSAFLIHSE